MKVTELHLRSFRSYGAYDLEPGPGMNVLVGANAVGKTNLIEALQLLTSTESFRRPEWRDLVRWGDAAAAAEIAARGDSSSLDIRLEVSPEGTRCYTVNGHRRRRRTDVAGLVPSVVFTPEDLSMIKGSAERRRAAVDDLGDQISAAYAKLRRDYGKVVRQRNALLKEERARGADAEAWDQQFIDLGSRLSVHRARLVGLLSERAATIYPELAGGEPMEAAYADKVAAPEGYWTSEHAHAEVAGLMRAEMGRRAGEEVARQTTLVGPHRDDITFLVGGREARRFGSQGQQRTLALAWKLAEVGVVEELLKRKPVLLLDDVMSELDEGRRHSLVGVVQRDIQTFVTTTNLGYFDDRLLKDSLVVELRGKECR